MATTNQGGTPERQNPSSALARTVKTELTRAPAPQKHLDPHTDQIRESIDLARRQIAESLDDIQESLEETLDWRAWVDEHPRELVGLGFALGFYLGVR